MAISKDLRARIEASARQLMDEKWAAEGEPSWLQKRFVDIEDEACEVADAVAEEVMRLMAARQASAMMEQGPACCPGCGREGERREAGQRKLQTRRGETQWQEPSYYCRYCRQSFFPSIPPAGP
jgi:hypothetical protein